MRFMLVVLLNWSPRRPSISQDREVNLTVRTKFGRLHVYASLHERRLWRRMDVGRFHLRPKKWHWHWIVVSVHVWTNGNCKCIARPRGCRCIELYWSQAKIKLNLKAGSCRFSASHVGPTVTGYVNVATNEAALQAAIANTGPISVAIDASHSSFQLYSAGVYFEPACSPVNVNHAVLIVGYGTLNGKKHYLVKNSWSTSWGQSGYIYMSRNAGNNCGIASYAVYPIVPAQKIHQEKHWLIVFHF